MTIKEEIREKFFSKQATFESVQKVIREEVIKAYSNRNDRFGFDIRIEDIKDVCFSICNSCDPVITIHLPKSIHYDRDTLIKWFKSEGFEWCEVNHNWGWRLFF